VATEAVGEIDSESLCEDVELEGTCSFAERVDQEVDSVRKSFVEGGIDGGSRVRGRCVDERHDSCVGGLGSGEEAKEVVRRKRALWFIGIG